MPNYLLEIEAFGVFTTNLPSLEVWAGGVLYSTYPISSTGSAFSATINYGGTLPTSLAFTFNDAFAPNGRTIEIRSVKINNQYVNIGNYLSTDSLTFGQTASVDIGSIATTDSDFLFDASEPALSQFTTSPTRILTITNDVVREYGSVTNEVFDALGGRDNIYLGSGNDKVFGNAGDDIIFAGAGDDLISGGADNDKIIGGAGNDTLYGGTGNDRIHGQDGNDEIHGGDGNDRLNGHEGDDVITGGLGDDKLNGGIGIDFLFGGGGNDQIIGGAGNDTIDGGDGDDLAYGGVGVDYIDGGAGSDILIGNSGNDIINGGDDNDRIYGNEDDDTLYGGLGRDDLIGGIGNDTLDGGDGDDDLFGNEGNDTLNGGAGNDSLSGSDGADILNGGAGNDAIFGDDGAINFESGLLVIEAENYESTIIQGGHEWEVVTDATASNGKTLFVDNNGPDDNFNTADVTGISPQVNYTVNFSTTGTFYVWIRGRSGLGGGGGSNDSVHLGFDGVQQTNGGGITGFGNNYTWGSNSTTGGRVTVNVTTVGEHTLNLWMREDGVAIDKIIIADTIGYTPTGLGPDQTTRTSVIGAVDTIDGGAGDDTIFGDLGNDVINGGADNDIIYGGNDDDTLNGDDGNDNIYGDDGNDVIDGGIGNDSLYGGNNDDTFISNDADGNDLYDGGGGIDTIDFSASTLAININLAAGTITGNGTDTITAVENIIGGSGSDIITGDGAGNVISGGTGTNIISGGGGNDTIYSSDNTAQTAVADILAANAGVVYNASTGNFYRYVNTPGTWTTVNTAANASVLNGTNGHLVVESSAEENAFITTISGNQRLWIGGRDNVIEGEWFWTSGPENGTQFWTGGATNAGGSAVGGLYSNWVDTTEPSNGSTAWDYIEHRANGTWWSNSNTANFSYVVEYEGDAVLGTTGTNTLGGGDGSDTLYGTDGVQDIFDFNTGETGTDIIENFTTADNDAIDIADLLIGYTAGVSDINDFVRFTNSGANTLVQVDSDGGANSFVTIAQINNVNDLDADALFYNQSIIA